ncbi:MAG: aminopeptidase [Rikenellaceae bacterium]|nr:aminopeptidase [Rikenellaceae bacterium]
MKRSLLLVAALLCVTGSFAKKPAEKEATKTPPYEFTDIKVIPHTPTKDQASSGTCWSFSTVSVLESDLLRRGKGEHDLSEMWIVRHAYLEKLIKYVRMHGTVNLAGGGAAMDIPLVVAKYGMVPDEAYPGLGYGSDRHNHGELDAVLKAYADAIVRNPNRELSTAWIAGAEGILDAYLGERPGKFTYQGREYTPKSFAAEMGINPDDYISITSFTHHPFYTAFPIEVPDNWAWAPSYNVTLDEMEQIADRALREGYTMCWGADVSDKGFAYAKGFAVLPETSLEAMGPSDQARWTGVKESDRAGKIYEFTEVVPEKEVDQAYRQRVFDNYSTTDDHGMEIVGIAEDQSGRKFYKVKNSWGASQVLGGEFYVSMPFFRAKTINFLVNKAALSDEMAAKLGIRK